eukprot:TRINITY_DN57355_c0_g1_i1.p1 TRINITY_DN57355_c0_g1~~TRINITY_DN57355_c0_g1_i1.p1  ORF type:complete len:117 (+),score=1.63 TRINITY_DN57355_c0_g1_i1:101-451(+)
MSDRGYDLADAMYNTAGHPSNLSASELVLHRARSLPTVGPQSAMARVGGACIYHTCNSVYGSRFPTGLAPPRFGLSNRFTKKVAESGHKMSAGPDCKIDPATRFMSNTRDWTDKIG